MKWHAGSDANGVPLTHTARDGRAAITPRVISTVAVTATVLSFGTGCQSEHRRVPTSWRSVDACLERHAAFAGRITADDKGGPVGRGELLIRVPPHSGAMAYRYSAHRDAVHGVGPPGTVSYYGPIALVDLLASRRDAAYAKRCFAQAYG